MTIFDRLKPENMPFSSTILAFTDLYACENLPVLTGGQVVDCRDLEGTNCYCDPAAEAELARRLASLPLRGMHWIDSGDYHYVSKLWTDRMTEPFDLVVADHHPDMQVPAFGDILSCGGWVRKVLEENRLLREVWLVGINPDLRGECTGFGNRVHIIDREEAAACLPRTVADRIPSDLPVYLSIDKDVLSREEARTNWDQGTMTLDWLLSFVSGIRHPWAGVDLCGGLSSDKGGDESDFSINRALNHRIHDFFSLSL